MTPTLVLIHGTGDTSRGWRRVQETLVHPSVAVDYSDGALRRSGRTRCALGRGILAPRIAGALGDRVRHMVFIAALIAPDGGVPTHSLGVLQVYAPVERQQKRV